MTVLYFQIGIILSISISAMINKRVALVLSVGWTVETFLLLTIGSPLFIVQLIVIWSIFYFSTSYLEKIKQINKLKKISKEYEEDTRQDLLNYAKDSELETINGKDHYEYLIKQLEITNNKVFILSGWISEYVIDERLIEKFRYLLKKGVNIYIGYGYQSNGRHLDNQHTERALLNLRNLYREKIKYSYEGELVVAKFPNHQKIFLVDNVVTVVGSANWLSNKSFKNEEYSIAVNSEVFSIRESERLLKLFKKHNPNYRY